MCTTVQECTVKILLLAESFYYLVGNSASSPLG